MARRVLAAGSLLVIATTGFTGHSKSFQLVRRASPFLMRVSSSGVGRPSLLRLAAEPPEIEYTETEPSGGGVLIMSENEQERESATLYRIILPTLGAMVFSGLVFPPFSIACKEALDTGELSIIGNDSSQFIQNFITVRFMLLQGGLPAIR